MGCRVLVVEDEVINAMALSMLLPQWGHDIVSAVTSGEDAIRVAAEEMPDVVLMDIAIHGSLGGLGAAREIVGRLGIPVIFMSGYDDPETLEAAEALRPFAFLAKPLNPALLRECLERLARAPGGSRPRS